MALRLFGQVFFQRKQPQSLSMLRPALYCRVSSDGSKEYQHKNNAGERMRLYYTGARQGWMAQNSAFLPVCSAPLCEAFLPVNKVPRMVNITGVKVKTWIAIRHSTVLIQFSPNTYIHYSLSK